METLPDQPDEELKDLTVLVEITAVPTVTPTNPLPPDYILNNSNQDPL